VTPVLFRPPFGAITRKQQEMIMDHFHYTTILWDVDTNDWQPPRTAAKVHDAILKAPHAGSIILCHEIHETTIDAMTATIDELKAKGFQFLTISEMIKLEQDTFKAPVGSPPKLPVPPPPPSEEKKP
jgi:peptidoglycan/xylan/chitin deacetylase (PgdA/CDA1 family)